MAQALPKSSSVHSNEEVHAHPRQSSPDSYAQLCVARRCGGATIAFFWTSTLRISASVCLAG